MLARVLDFDLKTNIKNCLTIKGAKRKGLG